jgi:DNA polymerase-1
VRAVIEEAMGGPLPAAKLEEIPLDRLIWYASRDADATRRVIDPLESVHESMGLSMTAAVDLAALPMIDRMQENGMLIDPGYFRSLSEEFQDDLFRTVYRLTKEVGHYVNPGSPQQVSKLLFEGKKIEPRKRTKTGAASTDDKVLEGLLAEHKQIQDPSYAEKSIVEILEAITHYREINKLKGTYADVLPGFADEHNRVHTSIQATRVVSGRLSSRDPNLLGQPKRSAEAIKIRGGFIAPEGKVLGSWDLDQIEMRIMADESRDGRLLEIFLTGQDIHTQTAAMMFGIPPAEVDKIEHRTPAKNVGFGVIFGITGFGLLQQFHRNGIIRYTSEDCDKLIAEWYAIYPGVRDAQLLAAQEARRNGFVRDRWGRIRYLPGIYSKEGGTRAEAERQALNHKIQGGAQGVIKRAMADIWDRLTLELWPAELDVEPILQVHDELIFELADDPVTRATVDDVVTECMANAVELPSGIPISSKGDIGRTWAEIS